MKDVSEDRVILQPILCPFYKNGNCQVEGLMEKYTWTPYYKLTIYEERNGKLEKVERLILKPILRL